LWRSVEIQVYDADLPSAILGLVYGASPPYDSGSGVVAGNPGSAISRRSVAAAKSLETRHSINRKGHLKPPMIAIREIQIPAKGVRSLVWEGEGLVDWVAGGQRYLMSGEKLKVPLQVIYAYPFDAAAVSPSGEFAVIYTRLGTKGLILRRGKVVREINRSYDCADDYEYPVTMLRLRNGREALVHCPDQYCRLEIEDLESGERLTDSANREPSDFFHSRLAASSDGSRLMSAGWIWHPVDGVQVYDVDAALDDPSHLDGKGYDIDASADESSATFDREGRVIVALNDIKIEDAETTTPISSEIRVFDLARPSNPSVIRSTGRLGTVMAVGHGQLLSLWNHPKLIDLASGKQIRAWPAIRTGEQVSSILFETRVPPMALDATGRRFAVADDVGITVLDIHE
jgi:hypothetical protein